MCAGEMPQNGVLGGAVGGVSQRQSVSVGVEGADGLVDRSTRGGQSLVDGRSSRLAPVHGFPEDVDREVLQPFGDGAQLVSEIVESIVVTVAHGRQSGR